jgi:enhancing lycopene biosynthesis protein 2
VYDETVCGLVNAKNEFGAYAGYRQFALEIGGKLYMMPSRQETGEQIATAALIDLLCGKHLPTPQ